MARSAEDLEKLPPSVLAALLAGIYDENPDSRAAINEAMHIYAPLPSYCSDVLQCADNLSCVFATLSQQDYEVAAVCQAWKRAWESHLVSLKLFVRTGTIRLADVQGLDMVQRCFALHILWDGRICTQFFRGHSRTEEFISVLSPDHAQADWTTSVGGGPRSRIVSSSMSIYHLSTLGCIRSVRLSDGMHLAVSMQFANLGKLAITFHDASLYVVMRDRLAVLDADDLTVQRTITFDVSPFSNLCSDLCSNDVCIRNSLLYVFDSDRGVQMYDMEGHRVRNVERHGCMMGLMGDELVLLTNSFWKENEKLLCFLSLEGEWLRTMQPVSHRLRRLRSYKATPYTIAMNDSQLAALYPERLEVEIWKVWVPGTQMLLDDFDSDPEFLPESE
jgi:hypothetical protein